MSAFRGIRGMAGPGHDHLTPDEHGQGQAQAQGHRHAANRFSQDMDPALTPCAERVKRKISSKGINTPAPPTPSITSSSTSAVAREGGGSGVVGSRDKGLRGSSRLRNLLYTQDLDDDRQNQGSYGLNSVLDTFSFGHSTPQDQRRLDQGTQLNEFGKERKQDTMDARWYSQQGAVSRDAYRAKDRLTPLESNLDGYSDQQQGDNLNRAESAFSARWAAKDDGGTQERELDHERERNREQQQYQDQHQDQRSHTSGSGKEGGGFLTIRDILDSQELRNQISELRRSQNSNPDRHQQHQYQQEEDSGERGVSTGGQYRRPQGYRRSSSSALSQFSDKLYRTRKEKPMTDGARANATRRASAGMDSSANSHHNRPTHERESRADLNADIQASDYQRTDPSQRTLFSGPSRFAGKTTTADTKESPDAYRTMQQSERRRPDLYHSSYSPSDFTQSGEQDDEDEEEGEQDQDTVEWTQSIVPPSNSNAPRTPPLPAQQQQQDPHGQSPMQANPTGTRNVALQPQPSSQPHSQPKSGKVRDDVLDDPGYDSGEISFEREVAIARAKRELGASADRRSAAGTEPGVSSAVLGANGSSMPPVAMATEDLAQLDIVTRAEDRFMELAGSLGEGQGPINNILHFYVSVAVVAVASVLGTLKAMIRQLKTEKKTFMRANKKLQKDLEKKHKELERTRKTNEKLSRPKDTPSSRHQHHHIESKAGKEHLTGSPNIPLDEREREQESKKAGIQREKDQVEKNLETLQKRIDALEVQRAEMQKRERKRVEEEADLLFLLDSGDDEEDEDEEDTESETESESASESEEDGQVDVAEQYATAAYRTHTKPARAQRSSSARRRPSANAASSSPSRARSGRKHWAAHDEANGLHSSGGGPSKSSLRKGSRSKSATSETRRLVEKLEEVHIHHHHHYGPEGRGLPPLSEQSKPTPGGRRLPLSVDEEYGIPSDVHRLNIGTAFRSQRRGSYGQEQLVFPASASRGALSRSLPGQGLVNRHSSSAVVGVQSSKKPQPHRQHIEPRTRMVGGFDGDQAPRSERADELAQLSDDGGSYQPFRIRAHGSTSVRARGDIKSGGNRARELAAALTNPALRQKKISIDLQRIMSLLKAHDPKRCTVCCNGGDARDHEGHYHQQDLFRKPRHQQTRHQDSSPNIDSMPVKGRQKDLKPIAALVSTGSRRAAASQENIDSGSSLSSFPDDEDPRNSARISPEARKDQPLSHRKEREREQEKSSLVRKNLSLLGRSKNEDRSPEQKLHIVLGQLDEEVQHLRRSYFELSKDLETLGHSSGAADTDGGSAGGGGDGSKKPRTGKRSATEGVLKEQLRQKKLIRQQLQEVVDSLAEKADMIMTIQERHLHQRQMDEREQRRKRRGRDAAESKDAWRRYESSDRGDSKRDGLRVSRGKTLRASFSDADQNRGRDNDMREDVNGEEERQREGKDRQDASERTDEQDSGAVDSKDNTQDTARPLRRTTEQRTSKKLRDNGSRSYDHDDYEHEENEQYEQEQDREEVSGSPKGDRDQHERRLKEPEGYRHRHANGFRVPKLH
ncbi:hypothetical protein BGZ54_005953 [Gamsiella multidivaricata]|nr:hypothetical protein BGZ54_005953 [Gamsiella multidivaricata]